MKYTICLSFSLCLLHIPSESKQNGEQYRQASSAEQETHRKSLVFEKPIASRLRLANRGQLSKHKIEEDRERERDKRVVGGCGG